MRSKNLMRHLVFFNVFLAALMVYAVVFSKGWTHGALALLVSVWLSSGPVAYIKNWSIPLLGPFAYGDGQRQVARAGAVLVMTAILFLLTAHEISNI